MKTSPVYNTYWHFAAERLAIYYRRLIGRRGPWTDDSILQTYRFTNSYRAADRVSQYLIREVQYGKRRSQEPDEVFFRTLLFKLFNKIETWEALEEAHGPIVWQGADFTAIDKTLGSMIDAGRRIYSAAYIMPAPLLLGKRKHTNHLRLIEQMMRDRLPVRLQQAPDLASVYERLLSYPGIGRFLAFQFAIDLNYSSLLNFDEQSFVVAGPGALDGISKCFPGARASDAEAIIFLMTERQNIEFAARGIDFPGLFGRPLQPIDCQNLFCEISKYARAAHPEIKGVADRQRIKQTYRASAMNEPVPFFPPKWGLNVAKEIPPQPEVSLPRQALLI